MAKFVKKTFTVEHVENDAGERVKGVVLWQDRDADDPRTWDNFGVMACWHRRYNLGDKNPYDTPKDLLEALAEGAGMDWEKARDAGRDDLLAFLEKKHFVILSLYLYDHSGITMNTGGFSCPWDSGQVGWIYATPDAIRENWGRKRITRQLLAHAEKLLEAEASTYSKYLEGDVWGFTCLDEGGEIVDSCGGFYGSDPKTNGMMDYIPEEYRGCEFVTEN